MPPAINNPPSGRVVDVCPSVNVGVWSGLGVLDFTVGLILLPETPADPSASLALANASTGLIPNTMTSITAKMELAIFMTLLPVVYGFVTSTFRFPVLLPEGSILIV
jgi:hypothetical protein